jgi:hypothetical protein
MDDPKDDKELQSFIDSKRTDEATFNELDKLDKHVDENESARKCDTSTPTLPRLIFFTIAVLAGAVAILTDSFILPGLFLIGFSCIILMNRTQQKEHLATPLTKWQIIRGFVPLILFFSLIAYLSSDSVESFVATTRSYSAVFKIAFLIAVAFMIRGPWLRWYRSTNSVDSQDPSG